MCSGANTQCVEITTGHIPGLKRKVCKICRRKKNEHVCVRMPNIKLSEYEFKTIKEKTIEGLNTFGSKVRHALGNI